MKLHCGKYQLDLSTPKVMGVLNLTPDSFSDGGRYMNVDDALHRAKQMIAEGVDIIDVGGESTRPGAAVISDDEEIARVVPIIEALVHEINVPISIDTSKASAMYEAVHAGASLINDVCALQSKDALKTAAQLNQEKNIAVCIMHMQGQPRSMQANPIYKDVVLEIKNMLLERVEMCVQAGINAHQVMLDPGFGFGKTLQHNLKLLADLSEFVSATHPLLVGLSRKSMIGQMTQKPVDQRLPGSLALATLALNNGANIIRVHDVSESCDVAQIVQALKMVE